MHEVLVNRLVKLAQEKSVVRWIDHPNMTIAVDWDIKHQTKTKTKVGIFQLTLLETRHQGYKTFPMLNSAEYKLYPAHKC